MVTQEGKGKIIASPLLPLYPFHNCSPALLSFAYLRLFGLPLDPTEDQTEENLIKSLLVMRPEEKKALRRKFLTELLHNHGMNHLDPR